MEATVANTIFEQLGRNKLVAMIGAYALSFTEKSLTFRFKAHAYNGINAIRVTLAPTDTYTVEFISVRGATIKTKAIFDDVYADSLKPLIESTTGLRLSL
jgi:hypothetical protein